MVENFIKKNFQDFLNRINIKIYSRSTDLGAVLAERFNRRIRDLPKRPIFEKSDGNWIDILPIITKQYNNRTHASSELSPKDASLKKKEGYVYKNLLDKRKKISNQNMK